MMQDLWESQTQGWDDLPNQVAEVALQDSPFPDPVNDGLSAVPFQDVPGEQPPMEPAFQDTGAAGSSEDEAEPETLPPWTCSCAPVTQYLQYVNSYRLPAAISIQITYNVC